MSQQEDRVYDGIYIESSAEKPENSAMHDYSAALGNVSTVTTRSDLIPIITLLSDVATRVDAAWARTGVGARDRNAKWQAFVDCSLLPFLHDFQSFSEAAERNTALDNDQLLRKLIFLYSRLNETPKLPELRPLIDMMSQKLRDPIYPETKMLKSRNSQHVDRIFELKFSKNPTPVPDGTISPETHLELPSFEEWTIQQQQPNAARAPADANDQYHDIIQQITTKMTHHEVHTRLQSEYVRLNDLAENRLQLLRLLCKQRALLHCNATDQAVLRARYAEKYLNRVCISLSTSTTSTTTHDDLFPDGPYHSALSSMKSSTHVSRNRAIEAKKNTVGEKMENFVTNGPTAIFPGAGDCDFHPNPVTEIRAELETEEELHLLLEAPSYCDYGKSSLCLQPRVTTQHSCIHLTLLPEDQQRESILAQTPSGTVQHNFSNRETILEVELDDIDSYGQRQDLSLSRIQAEAEDILQRIDEQNKNMKLTASVELENICTLFKNYITGDQTEIYYGNDNRDSFPTSGIVELPVSLTEIKDQVSELSEDFERARAAVEQMQRHASAESQVSSASSSNRSTATSLSAGTVVEVRKGEIYLPMVVRSTLTALSFAPVLAYVTAAREKLQRKISVQCTGQLRNAELRLQEAKERYVIITQDANCGGLIKQQQRQQQSSPSVEASMENFCESITQTKHILLEKQQQLAILEGRLSLLERIPSLIDSMSRILAEEQAMKDSSRERLMSRKLNMAKQLLFEEAVRKRVAKELPSIISELESILHEWNLLVKTGGGDEGSRTATPHLCVNGVDVAAFLKGKQQHRAMRTRSSPAYSLHNGAEAEVTDPSCSARTHSVTVSLIPSATRTAEKISTPRKEIVRHRRGGGVNQKPSSSESRSPPPPAQRARHGALGVFPQKLNNSSPAMSQAPKSHSALRSLSQQSVNQLSRCAANTSDSCQGTTTSPVPSRGRSPSVFARLSGTPIFRTKQASSRSTRKRARSGSN